MSFKLRVSKFLSLFILSKAKKKAYLDNAYLKYTSYDFNGVNNRVLITTNGEEKELTAGQFKGLRIKIVGNNNTIRLETPVTIQNSFINIDGCDSCTISIGSTTNTINALTVHFGNSNNQTITIGRMCSIVNAFMASNEENGEITIGEDCMLAAHIAIVAGDGHAIVDEITKMPINEQKHPLIIGNHVWIGEGAKLMKNTSIADNSIVGAYSVVTKKFSEPNIVVAGNPAKVIKKGINWDRRQITQLKKLV